MGSGVKTFIATLALLLLVAGCAGEPGEPGEPRAEATETTAPVSESESPEPDSAQPFAPNLGDTALRIGETREGSEVHTTLHEIKYPYPPGRYREPEEGYDFVGLRLEQCLSSEAAEPLQSTYDGEWSAVVESGEEYGGTGLSWSDWPEPKFPEIVQAIPGRCLKGWIALQVPRGTEIETLLWRPGGIPVAEWIVNQ